MRAGYKMMRRKSERRIILRACSFSTDATAHRFVRRPTTGDLRSSTRAVIVITIRASGPRYVIYTLLPIYFRGFTAVVQQQSQPRIIDIISVTAAVIPSPPRIVTDTSSRGISSCIPASSQRRSLRSGPLARSCPGSKVPRRSLTTNAQPPAVRHCSVSAHIDHAALDSAIFIVAITWR